MHLSSGLMFASFMLLVAKGRMRWLILVTIPLILNGIIQTETRGALVGLLLGGLATVYLKPKSCRRIYWSLAVLGVIGFLGIANQVFIERMKSMTAVTSAEKEWDNSAMSRVEIAKAQLRMFVDHPLGVGHQGTAYLSREYLDERWLAANSGDRASHNTVLSVLVDQGLPGIVLLAILGVAIGRILRRMKQMDATGLPGSLGLYRTMLGGSLVTIFGAGMFAQNLKAEVLVWNLVLLAVLWELAREFMPAEQTSGVRGRTIKVKKPIPS
jgi:O-antigen ligase